MASTRILWKERLKLRDEIYQEKHVGYLMQCQLLIDFIFRKLSIIVTTSCMDICL